MKNVVRSLLAALAVVLACASPALSQQSLQEGADQAVKGTRSEVVNVGRHGYKIQPVNIQRTADGVRAEGRIDHKIKGTDDFVYYVIEVKKGQAPKVTLDRIEYNGLFGGKGKLPLAVAWVSRNGGSVPAIAEATQALNIALKGLNRIQRKLIGKWEPSVLQVLDVLAARVAKEAN
jgi:hypothetical protein